jgi:hypothetical protein
MLVALKFMGGTLPGVWGAFMVFNFSRFIGVMAHHFYQGPLS